MTMGTEIVHPFIYGSLVIILGSFAKVLLDWEKIQPSANPKEKGPTLFRTIYVAPDFVILSTSLLLTSKALEALLSGKPTAFKLGGEFYFGFSVALIINIISLLLVIILWLSAGPAKFFPIARKSRKVWNINGTRKYETINVPLWWGGFSSRAGIMTLIFGNFIGFFNILLVFFFINSSI